MQCTNAKKEKKLQKRIAFTQELCYIKIAETQKRRKEKKMFNKLKFKAAVIERGKTIGDVAKFLDISESTLYRKINGASEFSRDEIQNICIFLKLDSPLEIFFANEIT